MDSLARATDRLTAEGYREEFRAETKGLRALGSGRIYAPEALHVDRVLRFEGPSDPADEALLFALSVAEDGVRGTYAVTFGPAVEPDDAEMVRRLRARHDR